MKISWLLWLHYKSCLSHQTKSVSSLAFQWCLHNKSNITWPLGDTKFLFWCWKINVSWASDIWRENFVSLCWDKKKSKRYPWKPCKKHHLRHHTEAVCKILKTSYIVYFRKYPYLTLKGTNVVDNIFVNFLLYGIW